MLYLLMLSAKVAAGVPAIDFDLRSLKPAPPAACNNRPGEDIVVCGRADRRLRNLPEARVGALPKAEMDVGRGAKLRAEAQSRTLDRGAVSQRAMITLAVPF
jgi:hypothetical protein